MVAFGLLTVFWDLGLRRQHGQSHVWLKTLLRDAIPAALVMLPIVFVTYVATWYGWFCQFGLPAHLGVRQRRLHRDPGRPAFTGPPTGGHASTGRPPNTRIGPAPGVAGAGPAHELLLRVRRVAVRRRHNCHPRKSLLWATRSSGGQLPWRCSTRYGVDGGRRDWRAGAVLCGFVAGWGPVAAVPGADRFCFYSIVFLPFMIMALTLSFGSLLVAQRHRERRGNGAIVVVAFLFRRRGGHVVVVLSHLDRTDHHVRAVADADVVADLGLKEIAR